MLLQLIFSVTVYQLHNLTTLHLLLQIWSAWYSTIVELMMADIDVLYQAELFSVHTIGGYPTWFHTPCQTKQQAFGQAWAKNSGFVVFLPPWEGAPPTVTKDKPSSFRHFYTPGPSSGLCASGCWFTMVGSSLWYQQIAYMLYVNMCRCYIILKYD